MADVEISFDLLRIDFVAAAALVGESYWGKGRSEGDQMQAFANSLCCGAFIEGRQVGFGRCVTDRVFFAHLCDLMVWPDFRRQGIGKRLVRAFVDHPDLARVGTWSLNTRDAHGLYEPFGFERLVDANSMRMTRRIR
ncbi:MAG: GNAT family N-acetyltransferase [Rhizobiaceae bacterium]|nr:GNAT family N-acetyltransferase [Rhizobiaceae bacterium]